MKTNEQIKQEVINYLTKTSNHTFSYDDGKLFKIINKDNGFYVIDESSIYKLRPIDIDTKISYYGSNAKCVIKHSLFLNKKLKSIKNNRHIKDHLNSILSEK